MIELLGFLFLIYVICSLDRKYIFVSDLKLKIIFVLNWVGKI